MKRWPVVLFFVCVGSLIGLTILLSGDPEDSSPSLTVTVGVDSGKVDVISNNKEKVTLTRGEKAENKTQQAIALATPVPTPEPTATVAVATAVSTPESPQPDQTEFLLRIMDAIGDPISSGTVTFNNQTYAFKNGELRLAGLQDGMYSVDIQGDKYESKTESVAVRHNGEAAVILEYLCSFEISVETQRTGGIPIEGAEVVLWKGPDIIRPLKDKLNLPVFDSSTENKQITVIRKNRIIQITKAEEQNGSPKYTLAEGDRIVGVEYNVYSSGESPERPFDSIPLPLKDTNSHFLRIWDTLTAFSDCDVDPMASSSFNLERGKEQAVSFFPRINKSQRNSIIAKGITDSRGLCRFENLASGIYFAQASKGGLRSGIDSLNPAGGGRKMWLGEPALEVIVVRDGMKIHDLKFIHGVEIQLKAKNGGIFMETTERGRAAFKDLTWGDYTLTVTPPPDTSLKVKTIPVKVEEFCQIIFISYEDDSGFEFAGRTVHGETKKPLQGIVLELRICGRMYSALGESDVHGTVTTDPEGSFKFTGIQPALYRILVKTGKYYNGFLPEGGICYPEKGRWSGNDREITIDRNIDGYEFPLFPGIETRFQGSVVRSDDTPVSGARISLQRNGKTKISDQRLPIIPDMPSSGNDGCFQFSFITTANNKTYQETITARVVMDIPENETVPNKVSTGYSGLKPGWLRAEGSAPVQYKIGDVISPIRIKIEENEPFVIQGKISTSDERWPVHVDISARMGNLSHYAAIDEDGNYRIEFPKAGKVDLQANIYSRAQREQVYGWKQIRDYCLQYIKIELTEESRTVTRNIVMEKAYYLFGRVIDKDQNPIPNLFIHAWSPMNVDPATQKTDSYGIALKTSAQGYFSITGLRPDMEHALAVNKGDYRKAELLTRMDGLIPVEADSDQIILIVIDKPE